MSNCGERWYRPPVVWLGAAILFGSLAGCIALIVVASSG
jgi:hypothetical protein